MGPYGDLDRPPLNERALNRALAHSMWQIQVVEETGSTNADLAAMARDGAPEGTVLVAEAQTAGRGRLGRSWSAPPRSGLMFSVLLRPGPGVPVNRLGWVSLLTGVAAAAAVRTVTTMDYGDTGGKAVEPTLKWPNDLLVGDRKLAGILAERIDESLVVGMGLNVSLKESELPVPAATSLAIEEAATTDREIVLKAVLRELELRFTEWRAADGDADGSGLRATYRTVCGTLGREVRVELPGGTAITGTAEDVDRDGCLVVDGRPLSAGDVIHVR
jgi:BirA family biotin operon repressor/biotin-[acetyl-CoA-carboxylase] ligase